MRTMNNTILLLFFSITAAGFPLSASGVSYSDIQEVREERVAKGLKVKGESVCLFQSGTADVKKTIRPNDVLTVFREGPGHELREVGKVKILVYSSDEFMKGEVVEGEIRTGDIAKKGEAGSLVIPGEDCN